jgi:hypothetical protein
VLFAEGVDAGGRLPVEQGSDVVRLLMGAAARALADGRIETTLEDVLIALTHDQRTAPALAQFGANEQRSAASWRVAQGRRHRPAAAAES